MPIPIENIYYLLCYAWDKLDEKDQVKVAVDDRTELLDLFAKILINGTRRLLKQGVEKSYVDETIELAGIKGKLEMSPTLKSGLYLKQHTICSIDDFSGNILSNQILISTLYRLIRTRDLDPLLKKQLKSLLWMLPGIQTIELNNRVFSQVRLHRNNRFYVFLMRVCRIIYENSLPTETPGDWLFKDFLRDERQMNRLFEAFLFNFYKREFPEWIVRKEYISWQFIAPIESHYDSLPRMETDITIENEYGKIILDAKYYQETLIAKYGKAKIHSNNLYQLFSYLMNQHNSNKLSYQTRGILVYPTIENEVDLDYWYDGHRIQIKTVNLNMNWKLIEERLKEITTA
ncbi:MAG: 5-methylcytosine-specific restriction endonuclease system specificity protein McrC [Lentimicrobium sp.]